MLSVAFHKCTSIMPILLSIRTKIQLRCLPSTLRTVTTKKLDAILSTSYGFMTCAGYRGKTWVVADVLGEITRTLLLATPTSQLEVKSTRLFPFFHQVSETPLLRSPSSSSLFESYSCDTCISQRLAFRKR